MAQTYDLGRLFLATAIFKTSSGARPPLVGLLPSQEVEEPYRHSLTAFLRVPLTTRGVLLGWWRDSLLDPDSALMQAISGHGLDLDDEIDEHDRRTVRDLVANHTDDVGQEWQVLNSIGMED